MVTVVVMLVPLEEVVVLVVLVNTLLLLVVLVNTLLRSVASSDPLACCRRLLRHHPLRHLIRRRS